MAGENLHLPKYDDDVSSSVIWLRATPHSPLRPGDSPEDSYGFSLYGRREPGNEVELVKAEISRSKYALVLPVEISST